MKKINQFTAIAAIFILGFSACKKDNPQPKAPKMTDISISGENQNFDLTVYFNEGVYKNADQTGDLNENNFTVTVSGGNATLKAYSVIHSASQKNALIKITIIQDADGNENVTVKPRDGTSIFSKDGIAMSGDESKVISLTGTTHETISVKDDGNGTGTVTWTANNIYLLDGFVFVNDGQTLTIEAGTVVKGKAGQGENASALIVARGGKIIAEGTAEAPIIFTAEADDLNGSVADLDDGLWGGLILLGKAGLNTVPSEQQIEGIPQTEPRGVYGGDNDGDNSGILRYVSIRHGGTDIGEGNEINGLTLGAVGNGTVIEYIEVFANKDDGIEFFGGTARLSHILVVFCGDDSFDYDQGFRGYGQFWAAVQGFERGDRLGEHDGGTDPETGQPYAIPTIFNATYVGRGDGAGKRTVTFRDNAGGHYSNSIFYHQEKGVDVELLVDESSYTRFEYGQLTLKNNIFYDITNDPILRVAAGDGVSETDVTNANTVLSDYFTSAGNVVADPGFNLDGLSFKIIPANDVSGNLDAYPADWFQAVNYKGAFDPNTNWAAGWTLFSKYMN